MLLHTNLKPFGRWVAAVLLESFKTKPARSWYHAVFLFLFHTSCWYWLLLRTFDTSLVLVLGPEVISVGFSITSSHGGMIDEGVKVTSRGTN